MSISIAIATYNRSADLRVTLDSLTRLRGADTVPFEILVIDNNSTDDTPETVASFQSLTHGRLRYIGESRQGLSHARNRATLEARYPVVAFLDDDVEVHPDWLLALASAYSHGDYAAVGGRAHLVYPRQRPHWLDERDEGYLTKVELGPHRRPAQPDELFGVNLSISKMWLQSVGGFRGDLGRVGNRLFGCEETEILARIAAAGGKLLYEPAAVVGHRVSPARLQRRWFWSRAYYGHCSGALVLPPSEVSAYQLLRKTWFATRSLATTTAAILRHGPASPSFFHESRLLASRAGDTIGLLHRLLHPPKKTTPLPKDAARCEHV